MRETPVHELTSEQRRAEIVQILTMAVRRWDQQRGRELIKKQDAANAEKLTESASED